VPRIPIGTRGCGSSEGRMSERGDSAALIESHGVVESRRVAVERFSAEGPWFLYVDPRGVGVCLEDRRSGRVWHLWDERSGLAMLERCNRMWRESGKPRSWRDG